MERGKTYPMSELESSLHSENTQLRARVLELEAKCRWHEEGSASIVGFPWDAPYQDGLEEGKGRSRERIESLEQLAKEMAEALEIAGEMASQAMSGYGYYKPDNPHNFWPDIDCCTPEEIANHSAACEAYDKGERISNKPWGIGTYTDEIPNVVKALSRYREVCGGSDKECRANPYYNGPSQCSKGTVGCTVPEHREVCGGEKSPQSVG